MLRLAIAARRLAIDRARPRCGRAGARHRLHGAPKQPPGFTHFPYVNPDAPKGGRLTLSALGSFDSLNPLIVSGVPANGIRDFVIESLMARRLDEPFTLYGLIAETVEVPDDRASITFHLNPEGALLRRQADHRRRRAVLVRAPEGEGPAQPSHLFRQGGEGERLSIAACASPSRAAATARSRSSSG